MIALFVAAAIQQRNGAPPQPPQVPQQLLPDYYNNPKLPIEKYNIPVVGGEEEIALGLRPLPMQLYGFYQEVEEPRAVLGNVHVTNPELDTPSKCGTMDWSVATYPRDGKQATLLQTNGLYNQIIPLTDHRKINLNNRMKVSYWIAPDGTLLEMDTLLRVSAGNWTMQAIFNKDSYDLTLNDPVNGKRTSTLNLGFPITKFNDMFKPMLDGSKVLLKEKDFYTLGPLYGRPVHCSAKVSGRWNSNVFGKKVNGSIVDYHYGPYLGKIYVSDDGVMYRYDQSDHHYLSLEDPR